MIVPAKYSPGMFTDSNADVSCGNRSLITSAGRQLSSKIEASNRNPVHAMIRSYSSSRSFSTVRA